MSATQTITQPAQASTQRFSWEKGPVPLCRTPLAETGADDQFTYVATEMGNVHNCIIRALNSIHIQSPHVPPTDHASFVRYSLACFQGLNAHHEGEEAILFPELENITGEKGLMDINVSQHKAFHDGFDVWGAYLEACVAGTETFDGQKNVQIMDTFLQPLAVHLEAELPTLLALSRFGDKLDLKAIAKKEGETVMGNMSKTTQIPAFFLNHDVTYENGLHVNFPGIPAPVRYLLREVFGRWNRDWWKFSTCDFGGRPRELLYYVAEN